MLSPLNVGVRPQTRFTVMRLFSFLPPLLACVFAAPVGAQRLAPSLDVSAGFSTGIAGDFEARGGVAFEVLPALRVRPAPSGAILAALATGMQGPLASTDDCVPRPAGGCVPDFPLLYSAAALLGWERAGPRGPSLRILAGAGYYRADEGGAALGLQGRLDVATPPLLHVALVASVRGAVLPNFRGDALGLAAVGLGLRLR